MRATLSIPLLGAIAVVAWGSLGCGDDSHASVTDATTDANRLDASREPTPFDCPAPESAAPQPADALVLELPDVAPPGLPFVLAVRTASGRPLTASVQICVDGQALRSLQLYRGRGSMTLTLPEGEVTLQAATQRARAERRLTVAARAVREPEQVLSGAGHLWGDDEDVQVTGDLRVASESTLTLQAGARVTFGDKATLEVEGHLDVRGTADRPVLFTRSSDAAWGGIRLLPGSSASLEHVWVVAGGGDAARAWGHSRSQPVIWIDHAELVMRGGGIVDNRGKAFGADGARVELDGVLVSRCDTGGELAKSELHVRHGHVLEIPDGDGLSNDNDNDGIYVSGAAVSANGEPIESTIQSTVFAVGEDDGIDHNNGQLRLERVWIERYAHEGIAASNGRRVTVVNSVVRDSAQGIEAGYGSPAVVVEHTLVTGNEIGLRFGDDYDKAVTGSIDVSTSIILGNHTADVRNHVNQLGGPATDAIRLTCSVVSDPDHAPSNGNVDLEPHGAWHSTGCALGPPLDAASCGGSIPGPFDCD